MKIYEDEQELIPFAGAEKNRFQKENEIVLPAEKNIIYEYFSSDYPGDSLNSAGSEFYKIDLKEKDQRLNDFFKSNALLYKAFKKNIEKLIYKNTAANLKRDLIIAFTFPYPFEHSLNAVHIFDSALISFETIFKYCWPLAFAGLSAYDIVNYITNPQNRYTATLQDIFLGLSNSQQTLTTRLGSDIPADVTYWAAPLLISTSFIALTGFKFIFRKLCWSTNNNELRDWIKHKTSLLVKYVNILPGSKLSQAEFALLWDKNLEPGERKALWQSIKRLGKTSQLLIQLKVLEVMANIASALKPSWFDTRRLYGLHQAKEVQKIIKDASKYLTETTKKNYCFDPRYLYANYLLWLMNEQPLCSPSQLFWLTGLISPYIFYANFRLLELLYQKVIGYVSFVKAKDFCLSQDKLWQYQPEIGNYDCSVCGDWEDVPLALQYTAQNCLNTLLSVQRLPEELLSKLPRLLQKKKITDVDLSTQNWHEWSDGEWTSFWYQFDAAKISVLQNLNLSRSVQAAIPPSAAKVKRLVDFMRTVAIATVDISRQGLGANNTLRLVEGVIQANTTHLYLSQNALGDAAGCALAKKIPDSRLKTLVLAGNQLGALTAQELAKALPNSQISTLDLSLNQISEQGIMPLARALTVSPLNKLVLSFHPLTTNSVITLGQALGGSQLRELIVVNVALDDVKARIFARFLPKARTLQRLDIAGNPLTPDGLSAIFLGLSNSTVTHLSLANQVLGDAGLALIQRYLPHTPITLLDVSHTRMGDAGCRQLLKGLTNSRVKYLSLAGNRLTDAIAPAIVERLQVSDNSLVSLHLAANQLTSNGANLLLTAAKNNGLRVLDLAHNFLDDGIVPALQVAMANNSHLSFIDLSHNRLGRSVAQELAMQLPQSSLRQLFIDNNPLGKEGVQAIAESLVSPLESVEGYSSPVLTIDAARALYHAKPQTKLAHLGLSQTQAGEDAVRMLCRFQPHTGIAFSALKIQQNASVTTDEHPCALTRSSVSRHQLSLLGMALPIIQLLLLLYLLYRLGSYLWQGVTGKRFTLFQPTPNLAFSPDDKPEADSSFSPNAM